MKKQAWILGTAWALFSLSGVALASGPSVEESCWKTAQDEGLLMRGSPQAANPGARQWNLVKIAYYNQSHPKDNCADQIFTKATDDAERYWKYIGKKYECDTESPTNPDACENYQLSSRHIKTMRAVYHDIEDGKPYPRRGHDTTCSDVLKGVDGKVLSHGAAKNIQDANAVVSAVAGENQTEPKCDDVADNERRGPDEPNLFLSNEFWFDEAGEEESCASINVKAQGMSFIKEMSFGAIDLDNDPELDDSAYAVSATEFFKNPKEAAEKVIEGVLQRALPNYKCYNNKVQYAAFCKFEGEIGGSAGAIAFGALSTLKFFLKSGGEKLLFAVAKKYPGLARAIAEVKSFVGYRTGSVAVEKAAKQSAEKAAEKAMVRGSPNKSADTYKKVFDKTYKESKFNYQVNPKTRLKSPGKKPKAPKPKAPKTEIKDNGNVGSPRYGSPAAQSGG